LKEFLSQQIKRKKEMENFEFYNPVHIIFGEGQVARVGSEASRLGKKALLVTYKEHAFFDSLLETVRTILENAGVEVVPFYGITANPKMAEVTEGVTVCKASQADMVIGLGGGSAMDSAKMIAAGALYQGDLWDMVFSRHDNSRNAVPPSQALPIVMVPTLPATGSEMNPTAVVTNEKTLEKSYTWAPCLYPKVSIVDPALTCSLPAEQTANAAADTISHVLEFYLTGYDDAPLNNRIQEGVILTVMENAPRVLIEPDDVKARANLQWASIVALNGWSQPGDGWTPMHQLAHVISAHFDLAHGAALSIIMPAWMKHFYKTRLGRYVQFAERVFSVPGDGKEPDAIALEGINRFEAFLDSIHVPIRLSDAQIGETAIKTMTDDVVKISFGSDGKLRSRPPATREDLESVYFLALKR